MQRLHAVARAGDVLHVGHAERRLDEGLEPDAVVDPHGLLDLGDHGVDHVDVGGDAGLRDQDGVEVLAGLLDHVDDVAVHVVRVEAVDPHGDGLAQALPVDVLQCLDDVPTGLDLVAGGHGVLEVEEDEVGVAGRGLIEHLRVGSRHGEFAALHPLTRRGVPGMAHSRLQSPMDVHWGMPAG